MRQNFGVWVAVVDRSAKATLLNEHFSSVFTQDNHRTPIDHRSASGCHMMSVWKILNSHQLVSWKLLSRKNKCCLDPNGFSSAFLKKLGNPLIKPLGVLFSFAFNSGQIPNDWRVANIMPIFKKGSSTACSNYRPISPTLCFCKLFERILKVSPGVLA